MSADDFIWLAAGSSFTFAFCNWTEDERLTSLACLAIGVLDVVLALAVVA